MSTSSGVHEIALINGGKSRRRRRKNPRGFPWSGCVSRPRTRSGKRVRFVRSGAGRHPSAFQFAKFIGRRASGRLQKLCRRWKRAGCPASSMGSRSLCKIMRSKRRKSRRGRRK